MSISEKLQKESTYTVPCDFTAKTEDYEDHTFSGIMFSVVAMESTIPVDYVEIQSIAVRGNLGGMTVWYSKQHNLTEIKTCPELWTKVYDQRHAPSPMAYAEMKLSSPIQLSPGEKIGLYVHSNLPGDSAIVYDEKRGSVSASDNYLCVLPGLAHLAKRPFSNRGYWGYGWRFARAFVGRLSYGVKYKLWRPVTHGDFPAQFKDYCKLLVYGSWCRESKLRRLPNHVILYILNMCSWNWFGDTVCCDATKYIENEPNSWIQRRFGYYEHPGDVDNEESDDDDSSYVEDDSDDE